MGYKTSALLNSLQHNGQDVAVVVISALSVMVLNTSPLRTVAMITVRGGDRLTQILWIGKATPLTTTEYTAGFNSVVMPR